MASDQDMDLPRSMTNLFTLLSGSLNLKSDEFINTELSTNRRQLTDGLMHYRKHSPKEDSLEAINKKKCSDSLPSDVLAKASLFLNLSSDQVRELFHSYLIYEFKGTPEMAKTFFTNDIRVKQLFTDLNQFYYNERLFTLFCMKQILSHYNPNTSDHVYQQLFHNFMKDNNTNNELLPKLISQLISLNESPMPSRLSNGPYFSDTVAKEWVYSNLKEQTEVLELLLIYLKQFEVPIDTIIELLNIFRKNSFGNKFTHINKMDCEYIDEEVFQFIGFLQSLIIIECLDLKFLFNLGSTHLIKHENAEQLNQLETVITNLSAAIVEHSPIYMAWMVARTFEIPDPVDQEVMEQLGSYVLQLNLFGYLEKCLLLPQTVALKETVVLQLIYQTIGDLLFVTFNVFEELVHSIPGLNKLCIKLFQNDLIAKEVLDSGLDSGLGMIISAAFKSFPFKTNPLLSFCLSLAKTDACKPIFEKLSILSNLTSFAEPYDKSLSNYIPTKEDNNVYELVTDRMLYRNTDLVLAKGTKAKWQLVDNQQIVEYFNVKIDGWILIYHRCREYYDLISRGQLYSVSELALNELSQITAICCQLIRHDCYQHISVFNRLVMLFYECYELFSTLEKPFPHFMTSILELSAAIVSLDLLNASAIWKRITGKMFMPYMIGLTANANELMAGMDTNTSILGQLIVSQECIKGTYDLCLSFLTFINEMVKQNELKTDNDLMASVIFIINEIFPSHHFWNYKDSKQFHKIGRLCFDIFNTILIKSDKSSSNRTKTEQIVIHCLMEGKSAQTLLKIIKTGETSVRNVILSAGNDNCLVDDDQIVIIRQSLSTLSRLLVLHDPSPNSTEPSDVMTNALFSPQNKPNMLIIFSHYVFQRYDTRLATLAVQLLRELAIRFPMSMLACLGSEAEALREHFLYRLEEVTEDLNLKIALLKFLSACAERQPGLMEMFLNVDNQNSDNTTGCLQTVLEILEEKLEEKYFCPFELHLASLQFLYTFWVGPHLLAIDSLKKTTNFWTLVTFPLFNEDTFDDILCVYILRILAREIFYIKTLERDKFDSDLENKFSKLRESDRLTRLSTHIRKSLSNQSNPSEDLRLLLNSWKELLISITRFSPFDIKTEMKVKLANDILESLLTELRRDTLDNKVMSALSDILLVILSKWQNSAIGSVGEFSSKMKLLLKYCEQNKDNLAFNYLNTIETAFIQFLKIAGNDFDSCDLIVYSTELLNQSLRIIEKQLKSPQTDSEIVFRLSVTSLSLLQSLIVQNKSRSQLWIQVLSQHFIIESLTNLLIVLIERRVGLELSVHIMSLLLELSSIETSAQTLYLVAFIDNLCISLQNTYTSDADITSKVHSTLQWNQIFYLSVRMVVHLVEHLRHHFVDSAITFVAIHLDYMTSVLTKLRTNPKREDISQSIVIITLCHSLSHYHEIWRRSHVISFEQIQEEVLKTSNSVIAFLIRPNYLGYLMEGYDQSKHVKPLEAPKKVSPSMDLETKGLNRSISFDLDLVGHSVDSGVTDALFDLQSFSIGFLQNISPNILHVLDRHGLGNEWKLVINTSFSSPNVDPNTCLSFGSIINCIHMCIKALNRNEKTSDAENGKSNPKVTSLLILIFEMSLSFMVSQAMVAQMSALISDVDKQIIIREIKSELNTIISNVSPRQPKRMSSQSPLTPKSPSATTALIERSFVKFLLRFVDRISQ